MSMSTYKFDSILNWIEEQNVGIFLGQELNVTTKHKTTRQYFKRTQFKGKHITTSESPWKFTTLRKPGGTMVLSNQQMRLRIIEVQNDVIGRWKGVVY